MTAGAPMKPRLTLVVSSLVCAALFPLHLAHDLVFGLDKMSRAGTFTFLAIMVVWLYGTLELSQRRAGYAIMMLGGLLGVAMPVLHYAGGPRAIGLGLPFVWTLLAMGASGAFALVLATRELVASIHHSRAHRGHT